MNGLVESNGDRAWYVNGKLHRDDGPALEEADGYKWWYQMGRLHRTDGPATITNGGTKSWYINGQRHRTDGPAIEYFNCSVWYQNGRLHRRDGPAIEWVNDTQEWWFEGSQETCIENRAREHARLMSGMIDIRIYLPIESSGSSRFPLIDLIVQMM
jgi:hypothetical protein